MSILETVNLSKIFDKKKILTDINMKLDKGDFFTLIGPTGAGKTTLLRILDILDTPTSGKIYFDGIDVYGSRKSRLELRRRMSYVQQKPIVFNMSVFDNVACGLRWRNEKKEVVKRKTEELLEMVGMENFRNHHARRLSGGETQRIAIARALITEPEILYLDEPTANLDPISTAKLEDIFSHILRTRKITVIMTTHDMSQGQRLADKVGVLINGVLVQTGSPNDIFCSPLSKEIAEFVGIENILKGKIVGNHNGLTLVNINNCIVYAVSDFNVGDDVYVLIRPEAIVFTPQKEISSARNVFKGEINRINTIGSLVRLEVDCGFPLFGVITKHAAQELNITLGKEIFVSFKATAIHVIKR